MVRVAMAVAALIGLPDSTAPEAADPEAPPAGETAVTEREPEPQEPALVWPAVASVTEAPQGLPPPPGAGMRVGGSILIGLGVLDVVAGAIGYSLLGTEGQYTFIEQQHVRKISALQLALGVVQLTVGVGLVVPGERQAKQLKAWKADHGTVVPKTGNGFTVGGGILLGLGVYDGISVGVAARRTGDLAPLGLVVAAAEVATGAAFLAVGLIRNKRYRAWERRNFATPSLSLLPGGLAMGMGGRF